MGHIQFVIRNRNISRIMNEKWVKIADTLAIVIQIIWAPFLWIVLIGQAFCQTRKRPQDLEVSKITAWPPQVTSAKKANLVKSRRAIIDAYLDLVCGKSFRFPNAEICQESVVWEDPLEKLVGRNELKAFADMWSKMVKGLDIEKEVHAEYFSGNGIVLDLTLTGQLKSLPSLGKLPMKLRTYIQLGDDEKVKSIIEHWGGNPLLDETNVQILHCPFFSRILGKIHVSQRRGSGYLLAMMQRICMTAKVKK